MSHPCLLTKNPTGVEGPLLFKYVARSIPQACKAFQIENIDASVVDPTASLAAATLSLVASDAEIA